MNHEYKTVIPYFKYILVLPYLSYHTCLTVGDLSSFQKFLILAKYSARKKKGKNRDMQNIEVWSLIDT